MKFEKSVGKKDNLNYVQVRGHVPKAVARQFKQFCLDEEIDYSEGLEQILTAFFATYTSKLNSGFLASTGNNLADRESINGYEIKTAQLR